MRAAAPGDHSPAPRRSSQTVATDSDAAERVWLEHPSKGPLELRGRCTLPSALRHCAHGPWVYDSARHGRTNRYFRGRFEGCDDMDLSPEKSYVYRHALPLAKPKGEAPTRDSKKW